MTWRIALLIFIIGLITAAMFRGVQWDPEPGDTKTVSECLVTKKTLRHVPKVGNHYVKRCLYKKSRLCEYSSTTGWLCNDWTFWERKSAYHQWRIRK